AEDGIRDFHVTGVQTCALPICLLYLTELEYREIYTQVQKAQQIIRKATGKRPVVFRAPGGLYNAGVLDVVGKFGMVQVPGTVARSEERRVGKEWGSGGGSAPGK